MSPNVEHARVRQVEAGPFRVGSERRFRVVLDDGRPGLYATLLPELAADAAVRRRYVRDLRRRAALDDAGLATLLDHGDGDEASPPWRLRVTPAGPTLAEVLQRRAPLPVEEATRITAALADILHRLHGRGVVLRDVNPKLVVLGDEGPVLTDVGLARVDLLSTRTAASLVLEGSPYASPEQLRKTTVDQRSDLYGLGVIAWEALTGTLPFGEGLALLRDDAEPPSLRAVRPECPAPLARIVESCLHADPEARPSSADEVARVLRGHDPTGAVARTTCQSCGAVLRVGQRLCTSCGKVAVTYTHAPGDPEARRLVLSKVRERADHIAGLRNVLESVSAGRVPALNFIVGDRRMYSKEEQNRGLRLPLTLFEELSPQTAIALQQRLAEVGVVARVRPRKSRRRAVVVVSGLVAAMAVLAGMVAIGAPVALTLGMLTMVGVITAVIGSRVAARAPKAALLSLRAGPAALPASDPLVSRLAALVHDDTPDDIRERIGELALAVQNLVDHRAKLRDAADQAELRAVTEPIDPLIALIEREVARVRRIDVDLGGLDEGALVRALASSQARRAPATERDELLEGLDRLRTLEDERAGAVHRLLEAAALLRRAVELGLQVRDADAHYERQVRLALQSLGADD